LTSLREGSADVTGQITRIMVSGFGAQPDYRGEVISPEWLLPGSPAESSRGLFEVWRQSDEGDGGIWPLTPPALLDALPPMAKIDVRAEATYQMGHIHEITGDTEQALQAYQQAWDEGLLKAALAIAKIKEGRCELAAAEDILNRLTRSEDLDVAAQALLRLGLLQHGAGRNAEAETTLRLAMDTQHSWVAPAAAATLGHVLLRRNAYRAARTPLEFAAYSDHKPAVIYGLVGLGAVDLVDNDVPSAQTAFRRAAQLDRGKNGLIAALLVARTLTGQPEVLGVIDQTQDLVTSGRDPAAAAAGALQVGHMLGRAGELEAASRLLQWAAESGQPSALTATMLLGVAAWNGGLVEDAERLLREAVAAEDEEISPQAAELLGKLLADEAEQTQPPG
jgi:tetratricopeptide (TPR) repeat protein